MLGEFDESIYLHQVIAQRNDGSLEKFRDLPEFLDRPIHPQEREWRSHFHVPIFLADYGRLLSTQNDVLEVMALHHNDPLSKHIEIETYTWNVLPSALQLPIQDSIIREIHWICGSDKKIEMNRIAVIDVVGLSRSVIGEHTPFIRKFLERHRLTPIKPILPAVTTAAQTTYLTGTYPNQHGIVANGWYDRTDFGDQVLETIQ